MSSAWHRGQQPASLRQTPIWMPATCHLTAGSWRSGINSCALHHGYCGDHSTMFAWLCCNVDLTWFQACTVYQLGKSWSQLVIATFSILSFFQPKWRRRDLQMVTSPRGPPPWVTMSSIAGIGLLVKVYRSNWRYWFPPSLAEKCVKQSHPGQGEVVTRFFFLRIKQRLTLKKILLLVDKW